MPTLHADIADARVTRTRLGTNGPASGGVRRPALGFVRRAAPVSTRRGSWGCRASQDNRFQIGRHDALNAELLRDSVELLEVEPLGTPRLGERLEGDVEADGVPESEAIRNRYITAPRQPPAGARSPTVDRLLVFGLVNGFQVARYGERRPFRRQRRRSGGIVPLSIARSEAAAGIQPRGRVQIGPDQLSPSARMQLFR